MLTREYYCPVTGEVLIVRMPGNHCRDWPDDDDVPF